MPGICLTEVSCISLKCASLGALTLHWTCSETLEGALFPLGTSFLSPLKNEQVGLIDSECPVSTIIPECPRDLQLSGQSGVKSLSHLSGSQLNSGKTPETPHLGIQELSLFFRSPSVTAQALTWPNSQRPRKTPYSCPEDTEGPRDPTYAMVNSGVSKSGREGKPGHLRPLSPRVWTDVMESE